MTGYTAGIYKVCGLSIHSDDVSQIPNLENGTFQQLQDMVTGMNPTVCGDLSENCVDLILAQAPTEIALNRTICEGDFYELGNNQYSTPGNYMVVVPQANGCDSIYNLSLETVDLQALVTANTNVISCTDAQLLLNGSNSKISPNSIFKWSTTGGGFVGPTDGETVIVNQAGMYTLSIIDGGCISKSSIQIMLDDNAPSISLTGGTITCVNQVVTINFNSPDNIISYSWVGPNNFTSNQEDIMVDFPGIYTVTVESDNGCFASKSIIINQAGDVPSLNLSANMITCTSPQVPINVNASSNNLTYKWTGPNGFTFDGKNPIVNMSGE